MAIFLAAVFVAIFGGVIHGAGWDEVSAERIHNIIVYVLLVGIAFQVERNAK